MFQLGVRANIGALHVGGQLVGAATQARTQSKRRASSAPPFCAQHARGRPRLRSVCAALSKNSNFAGILQIVGLELVVGNGYGGTT